MDAFNRFLSIVTLILIVLEIILGWAVNNYRVTSLLNFIVLALLIYTYFRMFSRNIYRRQQENGTYLQKRYAVTNWWDGIRDRWNQRKDYKFYKCPACRTRLRVPKGKGKLNIVCRKCGTSFQRRT